MEYPEVYLCSQDYFLYCTDENVAVSIFMTFILIQEVFYFRFHQTETTVASSKESESVTSNSW